MMDVIQVCTPWLIIWGSAFAFFGAIKLFAKILKLKDIDQSFKF